MFKFKNVIGKILTDIKEKVLQDIFRKILIAILESALENLKNDSNFVGPKVVDKKESEDKDGK
ncbi:MAG: hypothetical protein FADNKDHG_01465 [Holosporales bacterium]